MIYYPIPEFPKYGINYMGVVVNLKRFKVCPCCRTSLPPPKHDGRYLKQIWHNKDWRVNLAGTNYTGLISIKKLMRATFRLENYFDADEMEVLRLTNNCRVILNS